MSNAAPYLRALLGKVGRCRQTAGISAAQLEERLVLGPGWISRFESAETIPSLDMLLSILQEIGVSLNQLVQDLPAETPGVLERSISAAPSGADLLISFRYANHDATYTIDRASLADFEAVIKTLRDGLAKLVSANDEEQREALKASAVAEAFLLAVRLWPHANPSDLWWFVVYRAYCDPYNHPARFARLDLTQSWKRTGGWALEDVLVRHYGPFLEERGVRLFIADGAAKRVLVDGLGLTERIEPDKIDVVLTGKTNGDKWRFLGVVHVKASFAERRTDDVPLSAALHRAGFLSPLWTMDCKSTPGSKPVNRGELGKAEGSRSAKRKDIEDEGYFTGCFSYNKNTIESPARLPPDRRIYLCDFNSPDDAFTRFILTRWEQIQKG